MGTIGPVSYTHLDVYKRQHTDRQTHRHFSETTFFHVLSVVESESAIISNTIFLSVVQSESAIISNTFFFAITILPFLKEYGSKKFPWIKKNVAGKLHLPLNRSSPKPIGLENSIIQGWMQKSSWFCLNLRQLSFAKQKIPFLKHKMLQVNYPFLLTDLHKNQKTLSSL